MLHASLNIQTIMKPKSSNLSKGDVLSRKSRRTQQGRVALPRLYIASHVIVIVGILESWESAAVDQLAVKRGTGIKRQPDHVFLRSAHSVKKDRLTRWILVSSHPLLMRSSERLARLTAYAEVATVLGSYPASSDTVESEGRQMKQC